MRTAASYRPARRNEIRRLGLSWRSQDRVQMSNNETIFVPTPAAPALLEKAKPRRPNPNQTILAPGSEHYLSKSAADSKERLFGVAINFPEGVLSMPRGSHSDLRRANKLEPDSHPDLCGFLTTSNRFVSRNEARIIAVESGQLSSAWREVSRDVLSSDVHWDGTP